MKNLFFVLVFSIGGLGLAQETQITGSVLDGEFKNEPLVFAKISVKNANQIIYTNLNGNYTLNLKSGTYTLVYEFLGYEHQEEQDLIVKNKNIYLKVVILKAKKISSQNKIASIE